MFSVQTGISEERRLSRACWTRVKEEDFQPGEAEEEIQGKMWTLSQVQRREASDTFQMCD